MYEKIHNYRSLFGLIDIYFVLYQRESLKQIRLGQEGNIYREIDEYATFYYSNLFKL